MAIAKTDTPFFSPRSADMTDKPISGAAAGGDGESSDDDGDDDAFGVRPGVSGWAV